MLAVAVEVTATDPAPGCDYPALAKTELAGQTVYYTDGAGVKQLLACIEIGRGNHTIAANNAAALRESKIMYNSLLDVTLELRSLALFVIDQTEHRRRESVVDAWAARLVALVLSSAAL